jgi:VWFA-related protein
VPIRTAVLAVSLALLTGQQVFRSTTELVEVDVVVLDSTGRLVRGLTAEDFELYDEGKRQEVSTFSFVDVEPAAAVEGTELGLSSSNAHRGAAVYLIVIDHLFSPPQRSRHLRESARSFVTDHMRPGDLAAVIHLGLATQGLEFSGSKPHLLAAIDRVKGTTGFIGQNPTPPVAGGGTPPAPGSEPAGDAAGGKGTPAGVDIEGEAFNLEPLARMESFIEAGTVDKSYEMLELAAEYVGGFAGRRKSMLLFSSGVPIDLTGTSENSSRFRYAHANFVKMARQANVAVYASDIEGLNSTGNSAGGALGGHHEGPPDRSVFGLQGTMARQNQADAMRALALETGGRAILNYNDLSAPMAQIARDNGSFYLLGFRPESADAKKFRQLRVRVKRADVQVFARLGYGGDTTRNKTMAATLARAWDGATVADLLERPLPGASRGLPMRASASIMRRNASTSTLLLMVELEAGSVPADATRVDVGYRAIGADGKAIAARIDATRMQVSPRTRAALDAHGWRYLTTVDLPAGTYQLRVAAREEQTGAYGMVMLDVDVPAPAPGKVTIDSVLIGSSISAAMPTAAPDRELVRTWPLLPTARRAFTQSETIVAFVQLTSAATDASTMRIEVEDADGRTVTGATHEIGPQSLPGGPPIAQELALSTLEPGQYVLTVAVTARNAPAPSEIRRVPFTVRPPA